MPAMKRPKKILKITGISLVTLIGVLLLIPVIFKKQVQALVKREINKQLNATVDFKDVNLSLFRHFPKATITIKGLSIVGTGEFSKDTLIVVDKLDATAGLFSLLKGKNIKVYGLYAWEPRIHLQVNKFGRANWDIAKPSAAGPVADTSAPDFKLQLKKYQLSNAYLEYDDRLYNTYLELENLDHSGSGDFTADVFTLKTSTRSSAFDLVQDGIPYLSNTKTALDADIKIDTKTNTYSFKTDDIELNALQLATEGFVQMVNAETLSLDFKFSSLQNEFKNYLSMVPAFYSKDFEKIKTSGKAAFNGWVKGTYGIDKLPAYDVKLKVENASLKYPDLPKAVTNIHFDLHAYNKDGKPDNPVLNISKGHLQMDKESFDFHFTYSHPVTMQYIDAGAKGRLNLGQLSQFIKLNKGTELGGTLWADAYVKGPIYALENRSGPFIAGGFFDIKDLFYSSRKFHQPIKNGNIKTTISNSGGKADNTVIDITSGHIEVGNDPVDFSLKLIQPVTAINFNGYAKGRLTLENLKQFDVLPVQIHIMGSVNADAGFSGSQADFKKGEYDKLSITGNAQLKNVSYKTTSQPDELKIPAATLTFTDKNISLDEATAAYLGTNLTSRGNLNNLAGYLMGKDPLGGSITLSADLVNLNKWLGTSASPAATTITTSSVSTPFAVPRNMNLSLKVTADKVMYDKLDYSSINGTLSLNDEKIELQNVKANALDGSFIINGSYSTKLNKEKPDVSFTYDIKNVDVQKAFYAFNTIESLMPIGKYLSGKLHSALSFTGNLGNDMLPALNSLTGKGNFFLLEGVLAKFGPLEKIATILDVNRLQFISVKEIRNYIEFINGKVLVKPFHVKVDSIEMEIGGFHGFDQSLDYSIKMKLPRSYMGSKGNTLVNNLVANAKAKGIPVKLGNTVLLNLKVTGNISNPTVAVNLKETAGDAMKDLEKQAEDFAKAKADSLKIKTKDSLIAVKKQAEQKAKEKLAEKGIDTTNINISNAKDTIVKRVTDTLKKKATDTLKKRIRNILGGN